jgi:hypothetical protein
MESAAGIKAGQKCITAFVLHGLPRGGQDVPRLPDPWQLQASTSSGPPSTLLRRQAIASSLLQQTTSPSGQKLCH